MAGNLSFDATQESGEKRRHRHRRRRHGRHAGPSGRQALPRAIFRRRRATKRRTPATICSPTTSIWSRCPATPPRAGRRATAISCSSPTCRRCGACRGWRAPRSFSADVLDHHHHELPHSPRAHAEEADRAAEEGQKMRAFFASELEFYLFDESYRERRAEAIRRSEDRRHLYRGLPHPADHQGRGRDAGDPQGPAGRRHSGREFQRRMGAGPGGDQRPLCRRARHGRQPRHPEERHQGDRLVAGQVRHLHVEMELRAGRLELACACLAVGRGRQEVAVPRPQGRVRHVAR